VKAVAGGPLFMRHNSAAVRWEGARQRTGYRRTASGLSGGRREVALVLAAGHVRPFNGLGESQARLEIAAQFSRTSATPFPTTHGLDWMRAYPKLWPQEGTPADVADTLS